jgi:bifunctional NMN adenylyltransferase/nudix hydrolase
MDVGVVIGRFQVHELTDGHLFLINSALANHRRVLVLVGSPQEYSTKKNPLDYPTRERMIRSRFPDVVVQAAPDFPNNDKRWSHHIDVTIKTVFPQADRAVLYAGRESFKPHYVGAWPVVELDSGIEFISGTKKREDIGKVVIDSADFRRGIIYATQNTWPPKVEEAAKPAVIPDAKAIERQLQGDPA